MTPWWAEEVRAVSVWIDRCTVYDRVTGLQHPTPFTPRADGYGTPVGYLTWALADSERASRLAGARGMPHVPVLRGAFEEERGCAVRWATFAPKLLLDAIGTRLSPGEVGRVLWLPQVELERLAVIGGLGGDDALWEWLAASPGRSPPAGVCPYPSSA